MDTTHNLNTEHLRKSQSPAVEEIAVMKTKQRNVRVSVRGRVEKVNI